MTLSAILPLVSLFADLARRRRTIREDVMPLIQVATGTNEDRRSLVVTQLMRRGLSESEARLLTEAGVRLYKKARARADRRAAKALRKKAPTKRPPVP